jgi:hypothetical protein
MKTYRLHEADIQIPDNWQDNTINAFSLSSGKSGNVANLTITRDAVTQSKDVQSYADQQLVEAAKKLKGYKLIDRRSTQINGQSSIEANFTWLTPERIEIQQRQVYVMRDKTFIIFTLTARANDFKDYENTWVTIVNSIRLREI